MHDDRHPAVPSDARETFFIPANEETDIKIDFQ
jgi:hypothetical protein